MSALRVLSASVLVLSLAACSPEADVEEAETQAVETATAPAPASEADDSEETLDALVIAAREACAAGDEGFVAQLPEGTGFTSRGPDARVHVAWRLADGDYETVISTPDLSDEDREAFDPAVATFMRHNLVTGFDRRGITGAFRYRDGRFCVVQTEAEVIEALRAATLAVEDAG